MGELVEEKLEVVEAIFSYLKRCSQKSEEALFAYP